MDSVLFSTIFMAVLLSVISAWCIRFCFNIIISTLDTLLSWFIKRVKEELDKRKVLA